MSDLATDYPGILIDVKQLMQGFNFDGSSGGYFETVDAWQPELTKRTSWDSAVPFLGIEIQRRELIESNPRHDVANYFVNLFVVIAWPATNESLTKMRLLAAIELHLKQYLSSAIQKQHNQVVVTATDISGEAITFGELTPAMIDSYGAGVISVDIWGIIEPHVSAV